MVNPLEKWSKDMHRPIRGKENPKLKTYKRESHLTGCIIGEIKIILI